MKPTPRATQLAKPWRSKLLIAAIAVLCIEPGRAQSAKPDETDDTKKSDETIVLSPFQVNASEDIGYHANNTLAGTRINTSLRDVASPVSVVTKDFINDIGATSVSDILAYQVGSEGTRDFTSTTGNLGRTTDNPGQDPSASTRGRGLASYDITRDYFYSLTAGQFSSLSTGTSVGFDPYNLDEVTISRGPNSVLAGLGSPAGIINYAPQQANLTRNSGEVTLRYGSWDDKRATINANNVLIKDVLALRVAGEISDRGFKQQPAYYRDFRGYLAATYRPWKYTTIHVSTEAVRVKQRLPNTLTPEDDISQWLQMGSPSHTKGDGNPSSYLYYTGIGSGNPTIFFNSDGSISSAYNAASQAQSLQRNLYGVGLWQPLRFPDSKYGDWQSLNTSASNAINKFKSVNFSIDQTIVDNLVLNLAGVYEKVTSDQVNLFRPDYVTYQVDVNKTLPNGANNPHFGETFMYFRGLDNQQNTYAENKAVRATLTYDLNLNKYNKWLGRYNFVAFAEGRRTYSDFTDYNAQTASGQETSRLYYLGGTAANGYIPQSVPNTPFPISNQPYINDDGTSATLSDSYVIKSDSKAITKLSTTAFVVQGYLFQDRVIPMFGIRHDTDKAGFTQKPAGIAGDFGDLDKVSAQTKSYGVVVHPLQWLSVFYNHSDNFIPNAGSEDLLANPTGNPVGQSRDYGFSVELLDHKLNVKVDWYKTTAAKGAAPTVNFPLVQWTLPFLETGYPTGPGVVGAYEDLANQAGIPYKKGVADGLITGDPRLANAYTADTVAKGVEVELTYNVTKNWRIFAAVSKQEATQTNIAPELTAFIKERLAYWQSTPGLWTGLTTTKGWNGVPETGEQVFNNYALTDYLSYQAADGKPSTQLHEWKASAVSNYTFTDGALKGFNFGTGLRYLDGAVIGNPAIYNAAGQVVAIDVDHPFTSKAVISVDAWIGYQMKLKKRYTLSFQLRGQDLQSQGGFRPIVANSDGSHAVYTIEQPRSYYFTTRLSF